MIIKPSPHKNPKMFVIPHELKAPHEVITMAVAGEICKRFEMYGDSAICEQFELITDDQSCTLCIPEGLRYSSILLSDNMVLFQFTEYQHGIQDTEIMSSNLIKFKSTFGNLQLPVKTAEIFVNIHKSPPHTLSAIQKRAYDFQKKFISFETKSRSLNPAQHIEEQTQYALKLSMCNLLIEKYYKASQRNIYNRQKMQTISIEELTSSLERKAKISKENEVDKNDDEEINNGSQATPEIEGPLDFKPDKNGINELVYPDIPFGGKSSPLFGLSARSPFGISYN